MKSFFLVLLAPMMVACGDNSSGSHLPIISEPEGRTVLLSNDTLLNDEQLVSSVYMPAEVVQCDAESGLDMDEVRDKLILAGIDVLSANCAERTDVSYAAVCGGKTGYIYVFEIRSENRVDAQALDFRMLEEIEGYVLKDCP